MTGFDDDRELDDFLAHRSALHRRLADRDGSEPPPELDRLVLSKAREAIDVPAPAPLFRAPRWALPVALAASFVLALAVVMNFARMQHRPGYPVAASASPAAEAAPALADTKSLPMAPAAGVPEQELAKQSVPSFSAEPPADSIVTPSLQGANGGAANEVTADAAAKAPSQTTSEGAARSADLPRAARARDGLLAANAAISAPLAAEVHETAPALAKPRSSGAVQMPARVRAASDASAFTGATGAGNAGSSQPASAPVANNSARFARAEVATAGRVVPAREIALRKAEADSGGGTMHHGGSELAPANAGAAVTNEAYAPAPPPAPAAVTLDKTKRADPQAWMREILRLRAAGKTTDADRELAEFRKAFPSEAVPQAATVRDPRPPK